MALFNRNKQDDTEEVPSEIQEYYDAEKRERTWVAWLLALGTLVVTVLLALGLYFGGRWVYRQVFNSDSKEENAEQIEQEAQEAENLPANVEPVPSPSPEQSAPSTSSGEQPQTQGQRSNPEERTSSTATSTPSAASTPTTGPLPSAGPADTAAVFAITTLVAAGLHRIFYSRRTNS